MPVAVLSLDRCSNGRIHIPHAYHRDEGHHLFFHHEGMIFVRLSNRSSVFAGTRTPAAEASTATSLPTNAL